MTFPQRILCPVDFSDLSAAALRMADFLSRRLSSTVTVLHAHMVELPAYFTGSQWRELDAQLRAARMAAEGALREFVAKTLGALPERFSFQVIDQPARRAIVEAASDHDLLVMGTHGRSGFNRFLLGSVAERVLRETNAPVITVRHFPPETPIQIQQILAAVNPTEGSRHALSLAAQLAVALPASLTLLNVPEPDANMPPQDFCEWISPELRPLCQLRQVERRGNPAEEILGAAAELKADLLVIGGQHKRFADSTVLGATLYQGGAALSHSRTDHGIARFLNQVAGCTCR